MVRIYNVYNFSSQMVDTIDDMSALTLTNHNKLLVAQADYTVEVKDLVSDQKTPSFVFPTVDKVQDINHCSAGNYVATVEGKQAFQKSDVLIVRIYINWEPENQEFSKTSKRFVRPRIAGMVSPSCAASDEDYLDMIEVPITFMSPTTVTSCQKTGRLLIACGPTIHLFNQIFKRSSSNSSTFMDFIALAEVFDLVFQPSSVTINEDVIAAYCSDMISVFGLIEADITEVEQIVPENGSKFRDLNVVTGDGALNIDTILNIVEDNRETELLGLIDSISFPLKIPLKGLSEKLNNGGGKRCPFTLLNRRMKLHFKSGKVEDNYIVTLSDQKPTIIARSILALNINDSDELITGIALNILASKFSEENSQGCAMIHFFFSTCQEGYLFCASKKDLQQNLQCLAVFNFTAHVINAIFETCFLHVLTEAGLETYNLPSLNSIIYDDILNISRSSHPISIFGMRPFTGLINFLNSDDFLTIFSSPNDQKKGKESLPWTTYSLKIPTIYDVYVEIINTANEYRKQDTESYKYLLSEAFLLLQTALQLNIPLKCSEERSIVNETHISNALVLAQIFFRSDDIYEVFKGAMVVFACNTDPLEFVQKLGPTIKEKNVREGITFLMKNWIQKKKSVLNGQQLESVIRLLSENGTMEELAILLLSNEEVCRSCGYKAIIYLKNNFVLHQAETEVHILYALCILYTQTCQRTDVQEILDLVKMREECVLEFTSIIAEYWIFLFDQVEHENEKLISFSEVSCLLIEHMPLETSKILVELILEKKFLVNDIVQMLLKLFPCSVSVQKGHLVLRTLLEVIFSNKVVEDFHEPAIENCLKILMRSYLTQLYAKDTDAENDENFSNYRPIFVDKLPDFILHLPKVENISYLTLRRLQELVWNNMVHKNILKEMVDSFTNVKLKLNIYCMLDDTDLVNDLISEKYYEAILPYAKVFFSSVKQWRNLINLLKVRILNLDMKTCGGEIISYEKVLSDTLDYLSVIISSSELPSLLESVIPSEDVVYKKCIAKAQQISYANDVKNLIIHTSQQLLQFNTFS